jgi:hypothetical protein
MTITPLVRNKVRFKDTVKLNSGDIIIKKGVIKEITNVELIHDGLVTVELESFEQFSFPINATYLEDEKPISVKKILNWNEDA